ncbi:hypothetical protein FS837_007398 [Tulasnella sp. UAMH 9824]|nr:hypothetical protein FS837_007398 [Tulasnella sp. UAMH 9824]
MASPPPEDTDHLFGFNAIHTSGNNQIQALGRLGADKPRYWTFVLRPIPGSTENETTTEITAITVKNALLPRFVFSCWAACHEPRPGANVTLVGSRAHNSHGFSILEDPGTEFKLLVFHSKNAFEKANKAVTTTPERIFNSFDTILLADVEPEATRKDIDARLASYLKAVQRGTQSAPSEAAALAHETNTFPSLAATTENMVTGQAALAATPVDAGSGQTGNPSSADHEPTPSRRRSRLTRKSVQHASVPTPDEETVRSKNWRDANFHLRDIVHNVTIVHQDLAKIPAIRAVLEDSWKPSSTSIDPIAQKALEVLMDRLPDPLEDPQAAARLRAAVTQAAVLCGNDLSLEMLEIEDSTYEEDATLKVSDRRS